jgi:hypothetical protein
VDTEADIRHHHRERQAYIAQAHDADVAVAQCVRKIAHATPAHIEVIERSKILRSIAG